MSMGIEDALDWLKRHGKSPMKTTSGLWRWTLPDSMGFNAADELHWEIFNRLGKSRLYLQDPGNYSLGHGPFPWLYETRAHAQLAAVLAILYADMDGVLPE